MFKLIKPAPLTERVRSQDGSDYMYRGMTLIGWIPPKEGALRYVYHFWTCLPFIFGVFYLPVGLVISYVTEFKNFTVGQFLTSLQVAINLYGASIKSTITYIMLWRLAKLKDLLDRMDERLLNDGDKQKIHNMVARCNSVYLFYCFVYSGYVTSTFFTAVCTGKIPWNVFNPLWDWRAGPLSFWVQSIFEFFSMSCVALQDQLADAYPLIFTMILRTHFDVLKDHVRSLRMDPSKTEADNFQDLVHCIKDHKMLIRCCNLIRPIIGRTIFVQFLLIGVVIGLTLINMFFFSDLWGFVASFMHLSTVLLQTFPFCYTCNLLIEDCDDLANAIFQSNWSDAEPRYKSTLIIFIHHLQQPIVFIAGGIFPITMNSNISVAKFAFSIITIVKQMNLADKFEDKSKHGD
ncbi:hypothetical protein ACLKA7_012248 [Drosophila subpalustris]